MKNANLSRWTCLVIGNVALLGVLGFYGSLGAFQGGQPPFANPVEQRADMVRELREIKDLIREQNALLRGGAVKANASTPASSSGLH